MVTLETGPDELTSRASPVFGMILAQNPTGLLEKLNVLKLMKFVASA